MQALLLGTESTTSENFALQEAIRDSDKIALVNFIEDGTAEAKKKAEAALQSLADKEDEADNDGDDVSTSEGSLDVEQHSFQELTMLHGTAEKAASATAGAFDVASSRCV